MGHLYSPNEERGVFKMRTAAKRGSDRFFVNDKLGVIDLVMNPQKPDVLYAATYDMQRTPSMSRNAGPDSAIYQTVDGGGTWSKLTNGLPTGRIGDRARYLREESGDPLRSARQRQSGCGAWYAWRMHGWTASRARRRRDVSHRQRRRDLDEVNSAEDDLTPKGSGYMGSGDEDCDGFTQVRSIQTTTRTCSWSATR